MTQTTRNEVEILVSLQRTKAIKIWKECVRNQKIIQDHPGCDCEEAWKPIEMALNEKRI